MRRRTALALLVALPVAAALAVVAVWVTEDDDVSPPPTTASAAVTRQGLHDLVAASDVVVVAEVVAADGPTVTLRVQEVLAGPDVPDDLDVAAADLGVAGAAPAPGDNGIWFLVAAGDGESPYALTRHRSTLLVDPEAPDRFRPTGSHAAEVVALEALAPFMLRHQVQEAPPHGG